MIRYLLKTFGAHYRSGRTLYVLTVLGVALGVASVISIQILNQSALAAFSGSVEAVSPTADLSVTPRGNNLPESLLVDVLATPGVQAAWPLVRAHVALADTALGPLDILGLDFFVPTGPADARDDRDADNAVTEPGWVAVSTELATRFGWKPGDTLPVTIGTRRATLTVGGFVDFTRINALASPRLAVMDIAQAQHLFSRPGSIQQIDLTTRTPALIDSVRNRLRTRLGPIADVARPSERARDAANLLRAFRLNLTALSLVSVLVGVFLVYSSTRAAQVRRRTEFGILRSLGVARTTLAALIVGEVAALGLLGVGIGIPLGYVAARANVETVSATITNLYVLQAIDHLQVPLWLLGLGAAVGIGGAVAGAIGPAREMSRRDPRALLTTATIQEQHASTAPRLFVGGVVLVTVTTLWYLAAGRHWAPGGFVLALATVLALPLCLPLAMRTLTRVVRPTGFDLSYSMRSLGALLHTTATATGALAIAVAMLVSITTMVGSFRRTLDVWIQTSVRADVYVTTPSWRGRRSTGAIDDQVVATLAASPGVRGVDRLRSTSARVGGRPIGVAAVALGLPDGAERFTLIEGHFPNEHAPDAEALISEPLARRHGLHTDDTLTLETPKGPASFRVAGVYYDYGNENGAMVTSFRTLAATFGPLPVTSVALYLHNGVEVEAFIDTLRTRMAGIPLVVRSNRRIRTEALGIFDQTFAVTRLLQAMSLLIATTGITLALLIVTRERLPELALYRALGASRPQIFRVFVGQGLGLGGFGLLAGLIGGGVLAAILIYIINRAFFGWTIQPHIPWGSLAVEVGAVLAACFLASLYPALRASRIPATELRRDDR